MPTPSCHPVRRLTRLVVVLVPLMTPPLWAQQEPAYAPKPNRDNAETEMELLLDDVQSLEARVALKRAELEALEVRLAETRRAVESREKLHLSDLERARDRVQWAERVFGKGFLGESQLRSDRLHLERLEAVERRRTEHRRPPAPGTGPKPGPK